MYHPTNMVVVKKNISFLPLETDESQNNITLSKYYYKTMHQCLFLCHTPVMPGIYLVWPSYEQPSVDL